MITGIGIDIVQVQRMRRWLNLPGLMERYFHPDELNAALVRGNSADLFYSARFAAKEAFGKALGTGFRGIALRDIVVANRQNGQPEIHVFGSALSELKKNGANKIHLSMTHERENAVAMVVLEVI